MHLLTTKLSIPYLRSRLVARPRLIQKLNQGVECGFVLVSAPAGYGKSTLLSAWLGSLEAPAVWYSLDDGDNDPVQFLSYLATALGKVEPQAGEILTHSLRSSPTPVVDTLLTPVINQLSQVKEPFWLILDDYHLIQNQVVHQLIRFLIEHRPAPLHLAIATRADPPLHLSSLRARSGMVELRLADLRFTLEESVDFFNHTMGVRISLEDVARITARTEGWIAGLQIAALSMQNTEDISGFITAFTGSHHPIFDYLLEEILERQSPEIRRFLLKTSILEQITAPLCEALLLEDGESSTIRSASIILDELEHANLFIIPLDPQRSWYRYHPLFTDLLRSYLQQSNPEWIPDIHIRASAWFEGQGWIREAVHHALAAGEWERVLRLISANVFALLEQSELTNVASQLDRVTGEKSSARPWLWIGRAWLAAYTGQLSSVEHYLNMAEAEISSYVREVDQQTLRGHFAAVRAFASWIEGKREVATQAAREALEYLPETDYLIRCQSSTVLGLSLDNMDERSQAYEQALAYAREIGVSHVTIFAIGCKAYMLCLQGKLREAYAACHEAMRLARSSNTAHPLPILGNIYSTLSMILCEWNNLDEGLHYAREAVALARRWEQVDTLHFALTNLGDALFATGDIEAAFDILRQAWQVAQRTSTWFQEITIAQEVNWYLDQNNLEAALQRLRLAQIDILEQSRAYLSPLIVQLAARIFLAQKQYTQALTAIESNLAEFEKREIVYYTVHTFVCQALAYRGLNQEAQALATLKRALEVAAPEGYVRTFLLAGNALVPLLRQARAARILPDYVDKLLDSFEQSSKPRIAVTGTAIGLVEPLSEREMDVLKLLEQGCSDKEIAVSLVIARETVHKHLKNIYGKLDVHSRIEAIARARTVGLL
ncbi:MAG: LuxR C-terminal-related transcriptional regulator [Omnitrophica WOR_2 bacterium]